MNLLMLMATTSESLTSDLSGPASGRKLGQGEPLARPLDGFGLAYRKEKL